MLLYKTELNWGDFMYNKSGDELKKERRRVKNMIGFTDTTICRKPNPLETRSALRAEEIAEKWSHANPSGDVFHTCCDKKRGTIKVRMAS